jgi:hypothetical protein
LTFPNSNENVQFSNNGFKMIDENITNYNVWDSSNNSILSKNYSATQNNYHNLFTSSKNVLTLDATSSAYTNIAKYLIVDANESRVNKNFYGSASVVQVENSNAINISQLRGGINTVNHFGTGTVGTLMGVAGSANVYLTAKATSMYGGFFSANANSSNIITNLIGSYSTLNVSAAQTAAINNAYGVQTAINLPTSGATNVTNLVSLRTSVTLPATYTGTITNYYDLFAADAVPTAPGTITNKFGLYILGTTKKNYLEGNLGIGTSTPTSKLQVVGLPVHVDNAAAVTAGLTAGAFYHSGDGIVRVVF